MAGRSDLLQSISETIADYRQDEIPQRTPALINEWLQQFPDAVQEPLLGALEYVLRRTYVSHDAFRDFLKGLASEDKLSRGQNPRDYWLRTNLLDIQQGGSSQTEILEMFDDVLRETHGFGIDQTGSPDGDFVYLDDCIGTGNRVRSDVCNWLEEDTPTNINLHIITPILYSGSWWVDARIKQEAASREKTVTITKWRLPQFQMENRLSFRNSCDVLWPTLIPDHQSVQEYCKQLVDLGHAPMLRNPGNPGLSGLFEDDAQKILVEQAFLTKGSDIRKEQVNLPSRLRPLGYSGLDTLGFGSMFVTYRNCPNNCPLVLWVDQEDYPALFPRKTNTESFGEWAFS